MGPRPQFDAGSLTRRGLIGALALGAAGQAFRPGAALGQAGQLPQLPGDYGRRLRLARIKALHVYNQAPDSPLGQSLQELWDRVFERTAGALLVTPLPRDANLPGADADSVNRVAGGLFQLVSVAGPIIDRLVPDVGLQAIPYVYRSSFDVLALANTSAFQGVMDQGLRGTGLVYLPGGVFSNGLRVTTTRRDRPLRTLDDFAGLRIRIPPSRDLGAIMAALGGVLLELPINEVHQALASGRVDAQECPPAGIPAFALQEVSHWINQTHHMWTGYNTLAHAGFWEALPAEVRSVVLDELPHAQQLQAQRQEQSNTEVVETLKVSGGMEVMPTRIEDGQRRMAPVYREMNEVFSPAARAIAEPLIGALLKP